ncbi:MAG: hypothetical protein IT174_09495 [Acidobacteria bacterium]|nr:hypothetical protein [Acidobacteriota bacterium]
MKKANLALMLIASVCPFALGQLPADSPSDKEQILNSISEISRAYLARDPIPFERLYLENHAAIRAKPVFNLREQLLAMTRADSIILRAGKRLDYETLRYESKAPQVYLYGRTAIVTIAKEHYWQYRGQKCLTRTQGTELWVKQGLEWKFAASHNNTIECDPKPFYTIHPAVAALQSRTRPPANTDLEAEQQIRALIQELVAARTAPDISFDDMQNIDISDYFVATNVRGEISRSRSILSDIQVPAPKRATAFRGQDDVILVYGDAAVYTFRARESSEAGRNAIRQETIFFARLGGRWLIVAAHESKN